MVFLIFLFLITYVDLIIYNETQDKRNREENGILKWLDRMNENKNENIERTINFQSSLFVVLCLLIFRLQVHFWMEKLIYSMRLNYSLVNALSIRTKLKPLPKLWLDWTHILTHYIMCLKRGSYHLLCMLTNWYQSWLCEIVCKSVWIIQIDNFGPSIWQILPTCQLKVLQSLKWLTHQLPATTFKHKFQLPRQLMDIGILTFFFVLRNES